VRLSLYIIFVIKAEGNKPIGRPGYRWDYNIKMDLKEVGCDGGRLHSSDSGYRTAVSPCEHGAKLLCCAIKGGGS
jgi:hypothetical protein